MDVDIVVIGSGAGGLAAALSLAQAGKKVVVCEQHDVPGGWCHSFTLNGYRFSPGVHYIGGVQPGGRMARIYEGLGVSQDLQFCELNPDGLDHIIVGEEQFDIPKGEALFRQRLKERFPQEKRGIDGYFNAMKGIMTELQTASKINSIPSILKAPFSIPHLLRWGPKTGADIINHYLYDPFLRAIMAGQSGDHGLPPSQVSAIVHVAITEHYLNGGYYPMGGGFAIPRAFVRALKRAGGEIRLQTAVQKILIENNRAVGILLADGTEIHAEHVISNADPEMTYNRLIGHDQLPRRLRRRLKRLTYSTSSLSLFMASKLDLRAAGLDSGNYWFYEHTDLDAIYREGTTSKAVDSDEINALFLTVTTLKDPSKMHNGHHTMEAFSFVNYDPFAPWANDPDRENNPAYQKLKEELIDKMLAKIEKKIPGFRENLTFVDLGTPLTNSFYLMAKEGNLYGIAKTRSQVGPGSFSAKGAFENLWLCGASTLSHGVSGATASGLQVAQKILNCRLNDLLQQNGPPLQIYPAEDTTQWPLELQEKINRRSILERT